MIKPFKISFQEQEKAHAMESFREILDNEQLTLGPFTKNFEDSFSNIASTPFACAVSTGTVALEIIFRSLNTNKAVLVPTNTNYATVAAVLSAGLRPVLYDGDIYPNVADIKKQFAQMMLQRWLLCILVAILRQKYHSSSNFVMKTTCS